MTKQQYEVLRFIQDYIHTTNISPTYTEIRENCSLSADSHAHKIVSALVKNNYLELDPSGIRKIRLSKTDGSNNA